MVAKVSVKCPNCRVRLRMPLGLRAGKKPRCPKCKTIVRPADVLPPHLIEPAAPKPASPPQTIAKPIPSDFFSETKTLLPDGHSRPADPYAETKTKLPDELLPETPASPRQTPTPSDLFSETKTLMPDGVSGLADPFAETKTKLPDEIATAVPPTVPAAVAKPPVRPAMDQPPPDITHSSSDDDPPPWANSHRPPTPIGLEETRIPLPGEFPATGVPVGLEETRIPLPDEWPPPASLPKKP